jgi:DNA-binding MarR family transcriptional regulator
MADDFNIEEIDEVIHGRVRLGIMAFLSAADSAEFSTLKARLQLTDGNLSVHLRKLEEVGYVEVIKQFVGRKPQTQAKITKAGRAAFAKYLQAMSALVDGQGGDT